MTAVASPSFASPGTSHTVGTTPFDHNSFEAHPGLVGRNQALLMGGATLAYPPAPLAPWTWTNAGIAGDNSGVVAQTLPPHGNFAAYLQSTLDTGEVGFAFPHPLPGPTGRLWRLSFHGAQRHQSGGIDRQVVRVTVTTAPGQDEVVFEDRIRDGSYRKHWTRPFVAEAQSIVVRFEGVVLEASPQTALIDRVEVREVLPWSSAWIGGAAPTSADNAVIPAGACIGVATGKANTVDVQGELFGLEDAQASLSARRVHVHTADSLFQVGLEGVPYEGRFELVLDDDQDLSLPTVNVLLVDDDGVVEMHGQKCTSWLRLAQTTLVGDSQMVLESMPVGWQAGDQIVIAATGRDFNEAEQRTITGVVANPSGTATVSLGAGLSYRHCGVRQSVWTPHGPRELDQRAEVGLLSHNVKVVARPRSFVINYALGGHIMIKSRDVTLDHPGFGRFSGVELENLGRLGQSGRYPIHWHMLLGGGAGQFMKHSSIHHSNHRVVAVHGTDAILFEDNVAYEHFGHGVFIEDASEQDNVFRNNLVMGTRRPPPGNGVLPSDSGPLNVFQNRAPATFWITNPKNTFVGNVAAGGEGVGYWFALPERRMGESWTLNVARTYFSQRPRPYEEALGQFEGNSCHSTWIGLDVHDGIHLAGGLKDAIKTNETWRPITGPQIMSGIHVWSCNVGIYTGDGDASIEFDQTVIVDTTIALALASHDKVRRSVIVRDSGNLLWTGIPQEIQVRSATALLLYDGAARLDQVHLVGFDAQATGVTAFDGVGAGRRRTDVRFTGLTSATSIGGGQTTWPYIGWQDFAAQVPANQDYTALSILDPSAWAFSIDDAMALGRATAASGHDTVVSNHPMVLFGPGVIEQALPNTPTATPRGYSTPFRFGFLRVICTAISGVKNPATGLPLYTNPEFVLRYTRERHVGNVVTTYSPYEDPWRVLFHKQMAVVVDRPGENNGIRYRLSWSHPSLAGMPPPTVQLRLGEMRQNESVLIGLEGYGVAPLPSAIRRATAFLSNRDDTVAAWQALPGVASMDDLLAQPDTDWFADTATGVLWLKIAATESGARPGLVLNNDGFGQMIEVLR